MAFTTPATENLYGTRKPKSTPVKTSCSTNLAFSSTLSNLISSSSTGGQILTSGRLRPSKNKPDIFASHNRNTKKRAAKDLEHDDFHANIGRQDLGGVEESELHRSKRKLAEKAKLYDQMKKGHVWRNDEEAEESLVDFDRKWAEGKAGGDSESEDLGLDDGAGEMVEYEDEYGRARKGTMFEAQMMEKRKMSRILGAEELDRMSARPVMPTHLIYGDTIQTAAFNPEEPVAQKMEDIAMKRDRSATPPEMRHYEADKEYRIKGVGFYSFSKDEKVREKEMKELKEERQRTENTRREREERKTRRRLEVEERKRAIGDKRAKRLADTFLDNLT